MQNLKQCIYAALYLLMLGSHGEFFATTFSRLKIVKSPGVCRNGNRICVQERHGKKKVSQVRLRSHIGQI